MPCRKLFFAGAIAILSTSSGSARDLFWVDTFNSSKTGILPAGWTGRSEAAAQFYLVAEDGKSKFLRAHTKNSHEFIGRQVTVDIVKYPYLNWRWRAQILPPGGNESIKKTGDSPASVSVILEDDRILGIPKPKTLKYVWSTTLAQGAITKSPWAVWPSRCDIVVLQSGPAQKGVWITEKRNILQDYLKFYNLNREDVTAKVIKGIVLMSDSDNTASESAADYDDFYFSAD